MSGNAGCNAALYNLSSDKRMPNPQQHKYVEIGFYIMLLLTTTPFESAPRHWCMREQPHTYLKLDVALQEKELSMTGRNWGEAIIDGSTLVFNVAGKPALRIPLTDVGQVSLMSKCPMVHPEPSYDCCSSNSHVSMDAQVCSYA